MSYGSQTIQQQGRVFQVTKEDGSGTGEHGQGKGFTLGKNRSWKLASDCKHCGVRFPGRYGEKNEYCSQYCFNEFRLMKWLPCSICIASIGIGSQGASKLLGIIDAAPIRKKWKERGIKSDRPKSGSIIHEGRAIAAKARKEEKAKWDQYEKAWMDEIKSHKAFPDWGYEWVKEQSRRKSDERYSNMTKDEKADYNERCLINRHKRWERDPESRLRDRAKVKEWDARNPERKREQVRKSIAKRKIIDPGFKIQCNLRNRMKEIMNSTRKGGWSGIANFTGCNTKQLAKHLESGFTKRMTWENYGTYWHVDHILPCASFDHTDEKQVAQCWHWTNLRALEAKKNMDKSDSITEPQMQLLLCATH
jgi:hypothetical protein